MTDWKSLRLDPLPHDMTAAECAVATASHLVTFRENMHVKGIF